jgi:benzylsuccinate CoA-transferase BbsF subunit
MSGWSRQHGKQWIADAAQAAHVPSFPLREPGEQLESPQLQHRNFWRPVALAGRTVKVPGSPFGLQLTPGTGTRAQHEVGPMPLSGLRVLDFSWVIAGPTATRYLAAMGADVIKIEAPGRGDPGRASELHMVLGQSKRSIILDLKRPEAIATARALAARSDVVIENFATGVMERLGLGVRDLQAVNPDLIYVSASGLGRTGPEAHAVAYGTLLQCYAGFSGLNRHPDIPPRVGLAWLDPMCGLLLAFAAAAAIWHRRRMGGGARIDFSMVEAMLWTMAEPLLETQLSAAPQPRGNDSASLFPHGAYRCAGEDDWISLAVTTDREWQQLCALVPDLAPMAELQLGRRRQRQAAIDEALAAWLRIRPAASAEAELLQAGIPAAALANARDLVDSKHLAERGFWDPYGSGVLPALPWRASCGRVTAPAPELGADTGAVLCEVLDLSEQEIGALRRSGALG